MRRQMPPRDRIEPCVRILADEQLTAARRVTNHREGFKRRALPPMRPDSVDPHLDEANEFRADELNIVHVLFNRIH